MRKTAYFVLACAGVFVLAAGFQACKNVSIEELKQSMQLVDIETKWVSKFYQPWPPRLILVPAVSFRVKNTSSKPLTYINFNAIFGFKGEAENLGDNFLAAIRGKAVAPGETSDIIALKSNFGVEGRTVKSIEENPMWKPVIVKIFARSKGSQFVLLGEYDVSRTIDFKEPEPVEVKPNE